MNRTVLNLECLDMNNTMGSLEVAKPLAKAISKDKLTRH